jgi:uncharacterized protein with ATP-grasp and redox domains
MAEYLAGDCRYERAYEDVMEAYVHDRYTEIERGLNMRWDYTYRQTGYERSLDTLIAQFTKDSVVERDRQQEQRRREAEAYEREQKAKRDEGDKDALENLVWMLGAIEGNWEEREEFAMGVLGLENEDLEEATRKVVESGV